MGNRSMAVTQDSANRAYAHGAKDAEEALKLSRESWDTTNTNGSVNSGGTSGSFGTTVIVKKKKRKSLLSKLDDSSTSKLSRSRSVPKIVDQPSSKVSSSSSS